MKKNEKKLEQKNEDFMKTFFWNRFGRADIPEAEWIASESNLKFSESLCYRGPRFVALILLMHQKQTNYKRMNFANLFFSFQINSQKMEKQEIKKELDFSPSTRI